MANQKELNIILKIAFETSFKGQCLSYNDAIDKDWTIFFEDKRTD